MKRLAIVLLALLLVLSGCAGDKPSKESSKTEAIESSETAVQGKVRYFRYLGGDDPLDPSRIVELEARYDNIYYKGNRTITALMETYRYARYLWFDEAGNGKYVYVSYDQKKADGYYEPVFEVTEMDMQVPTGDPVAIVNSPDGKKFLSFFFDDTGRMHIDSTNGMGYEIFEEIGEKELQGILNGTTGYSALADAKVGSEVAFGRYEQDICTTNGSDPIIWEVLAIEDGKALLLSKYVIDDHTFNNQAGDTTWEKSSLRSFLNNEFFEQVFSDEEKARIVSTHLKNSDEYEPYLSSYWKAGSDYIQYDRITTVQNGNDTDDRVFILDLGEIRHYLGDEDGYMPIFISETQKENWLETWTQFGIDFSLSAGGRIAAPSEAIVRWSKVGFSEYHQDQTRHYANYWVRTMADGQDRALVVTNIGALVPFRTSESNVGVRPAIWVELP